MEISAAQVKELREKTGAGVMDCRRALEESGGDINKAAELLKARGIAAAEKRTARVATQGTIDAYLHAGGRIGAMVEVNCETDFVARLPEFRTLAHDVAMQVAATNPKYVRLEDIPDGSTEEPAEVVLMEQPFIKEPSRKIRDIVTELIAKTGENIQIRRFTRYELGA